MANNVSLIHKISEFYKNIYQINKQINKRDRLGIGQKIENLTLDVLELAIKAAYLSKMDKSPILKSIRIKIEILKQLVRLAMDIKAFSNNQYLKLETQLIEISKMNNSWLNWVVGKESPK